jgi:hypothetical protein
MYHRATLQVRSFRPSCTLVDEMDRQTTFLLALGMLIAAALSVGVSGWVLFARDRALVRLGHPVSTGPQDSQHHEGLEGS